MMLLRLQSVTSAFAQHLLRLQASLREQRGGTLLAAGANTRAGEHQGEVFIVGAGPGDAELLTRKAYRLLQEADVVLFDWLVDESVLACIPRHVSKEFVGKRCGKHSVPQDQICSRLVRLAQEGKRVVRLKGGDPAVFARTCEETQALEAAAIPFAIVPGITAASGASAYTGIPLTDRRSAQALTMMTAQFQDPSKEADWGAIARQASHHTTVVYMGLKRLEQLSQRLLAHGISNDMPVAVIENACCRNQKVIIATVTDIVERVDEADVQGPALVIIGKVVSARQHVNLSLLQEAQPVIANG